MGEAVQKSAGGNDDRPASDRPAIHQVNTAYAVILNNQGGHFSLLDVQVGFALEHFLHPDAVLLLIALSPGRPDGRSAAGIQKTKLDPDGIGYFTHHAAERVNLPDQMAFGDSTDGGIAGHLRDQVGVHRDHRGAEAQAGAGTRSFAAGMAAADNHNVVEH